VSNRGIRGPKSKSSDVARTNAPCPDFGIADIGNIAGNGTYETKNEQVGKFVCRTCGRSFTSRRGTIFHELITDQDALILGLKMVLNDIPLRKIYYILDINLDTISGNMHPLAIPAYSTDPPQNGHTLNP